MPIPTKSPFMSSHWREYFLNLDFELLSRDSPLGSCLMLANCGGWSSAKVWRISQRTTMSGHFAEIAFLVDLWSFFLTLLKALTSDNWSNSQASRLYPIFSSIQWCDEHSLRTKTIQFVLIYLSNVADLEGTGLWLRRSRGVHIT